MGLNTDEITVGANGKLMVGPPGTAVPASPTAVPNAAFVDVGGLSEDGLKLTDSKTIEDIKLWQMFYAARKIVTERDFQIAAVLRQWNAANVALAFGGGEVSTVSSGVFKYEPPSPETLDERILLAYWNDGADKYLLIVPRVIVTENVETTLARSAPADLPLTFSVLGDDGVVPWSLLTTATSFDPA